MTDLSDLIERVKAAKGPDRELDAEIMFDLFAKPVGQKDDGGPTGYLWPEDNPSWNFGIRFPGKDREWFKKCRERIDGETLLIERDGALVLMNALRIPTLTASVDAITALADQRLPDAMKRIQDDMDGNGAEADLVLGNGARIHGHAATWPLALCLALLTALQEPKP